MLLLLVVREGRLSAESVLPEEAMEAEVVAREVGGDVGCCEREEVGRLVLDEPVRPRGVLVLELPAFALLEVVADGKPFEAETGLNVLLSG